jgi:L-iditol 2-dehydrogenase
MGHGVNGAFARYVVLRSDQLYRIPQNFTMEEASMSEPFAAAVQAVTEIAAVRSGDIALVSGPGPIGLLCLKLLVAQGIKTIVVGARGDDDRLEAAERFGAAAVVNLGRDTLKDAIEEHTDAAGVDVAFECAGVAASVKGCLESLRPMGQHVQVAICGREIQMPIDRIFYKQLTMSGSVCYTASTWERMMRIYASGEISLAEMISVKLPISEWRTGFDLCTSKKALKVLLYPE